MASQSSTFEILLRTIADVTGFTQVKTAAQSTVSQVEAINQRLSSAFNTVNRSLQLLGVGIAVHQLEEYGRKAAEVRDQQAAWTYQLLRGKYGSAELVEQLAKFNEELERTTGTT